MSAPKLSKLLKDWRSDRRLTQREAAVALGINKRTLENWEQDRCLPVGYGLKQLIHFLSRKS